MLHSLKSKISTIYFFLIIMTIVVGVTSVFSLFSLTHAINGLMTNNYKSINAISNMIEAVEGQDSAILIYINGNKKKGLEMFQAKESLFLKWFGVEVNNITEPRERDYVALIQRYYSKYHDSFNQLQNEEKLGQYESAEHFYDTVIQLDYQAIKGALQELIKVNETAMFHGKEKAINNAQSYMYISLVLSLFLAFVGFLVSRYYANKFLDPLQKLTQSIQSIKLEGSGIQPIIPFNKNLYEDDEIGELALEFSNMTKRLNTYDQSSIGKLMTEKNRSLAIVRSITEPLFVLDDNFNIQLANQACERFFNISEENVLNCHFLEFINNNLMFEHIRELISVQKEFSEKIIVIEKDNEPAYFNIIVTKVRDSNGKSSGVVVLLHNVTNLKLLEKSKTEFIASISHEIKTPLTSIIMGASLLNDANIGVLTPKQQDIIDAIQEDGDRITVLIKDLLEISRLESGHAIYNMHLKSIEEIIRASVQNHFDLAVQKGIHITSEISGDLSQVNIDSEKISWVVNNFITNAIKHSEQGDEVLVSAHSFGNKLHVSVKDSGMGIPEEYLEKVFDKFFQVKGKDTEMHGTGLGLAIAKDIIKYHGGDIWCESKLYEGSTFHFTLPIQ